MNTNIIKKRIYSLTARKTLTQNDILFILRNTIEVNDKLLNIELYNEWFRRYYNFFSRSHKKLTFKAVEFRGLNLTGIDFRYSIFENCKFTDCNCTDGTFSDSEFRNVTFWGVNLESANFQGSRFIHSKLDEIETNGQVCFIETFFDNCKITFTKLDISHIDFTYSRIYNTSFAIPTRSEEGSYTVTNPTGLGNGIVEDGRFLNFRIDNCYLEKCRFINLTISTFSAQYASMSDCDIINCKNDYAISIKGISLKNVRIDRIFFNKLFEKATIKEYDDLLTILNNYRSTSNYADASYTYIYMQNMSIKKMYSEYKSNKIQNFSNLFLILLLFFYRAFSKYGESPGRIILFSTLGIIFSGFIFYFFRLSNACGVFNNLYLSFITFTTVGYGDYEPINAWGRTLAILEGFAGPFMVSLFVVSLVKKLMELRK